MEFVFKHKNLNSSFPALITGLSGPQVLVERLKEMGFYPGQLLKFMARGPLRGPLLFKVAGVVIALREEEARCLRLQLLP